MQSARTPSRIPSKLYDSIVIEQGFNQLKNEVEGSRMYSTETTYRGKLFIYALAESLRLTMLVKAKNVSRDNPSLKIPEDSMRKVFLQLNGLTAVKHRSTNAFVTRPVPKKKRDLLALLDLPCPPQTLYRFR